MNWRQFTPKGECKSCGNVCERSACAARKFWEFPQDLDKVIINHFGEHSCSLVKRKIEGEVTELIQGTIRASTVKRNILSSMLKDGAELDDIENKAEQLLDRRALNKIRIQGKGESEFSKLVNLKDKKNYRFFLYRLNNRDHNSQPTYVVKTSASVVEMGKKLDRDGDHYLNSSYESVHKRKRDV